MTCRTRCVGLTLGLLLGPIALAACFDHVPLIAVTTPVFIDVTPQDATDVHDELATFRWGLAASPDGGRITGLASVEPWPTFQFERRGAYQLERWIVAGLSERLTHHVVVTVIGARPVADVIGGRSLAVGEVTELDARASASPEGRTLAYRWQLATRPTTSQLELPPADTHADRLAFTPDVAGGYVVEVVVFDGELWSEPAAILVEARE